MRFKEFYNQSSKIQETSTPDIESGIQKFLDTELNGTVRIIKLDENKLEFEVADSIMNKIISEMKRLGANVTNVEAKHVVTFEVEE